MNDFYGCLAMGQKFEKKALEYFTYDNAYFPKGNFKEYDFILDDDIKVEVKSDCLAGKTGNLAIEYKCNDKASGITATTADFWIYFVRYDFNDLENFDVYKIPIKKLRKKCKKYGVIKSGGDNNRARMYLVKKEKFKKYLIFQSKKREEDACLFS
jgi:hypothetical protein